MKQYLDLLNDVLVNGNDRMDRTGVGTRAVFGRQMRFNLSKGFPILTTKKVHWKSIVYELLWFIKGDTNIKYLKDNGVTIWDEWADKNGDLGPVYGQQWRNFGCEGQEINNIRHIVGNNGDVYGEYGNIFSVTRKQFRGVDQLKELIVRLKVDPNSRRHLVVAWNPIELPLMALPPCHCLFQFFVSGNKLSCQLYQRSVS